MHNGPFQYRVSACTAACCSAVSPPVSGEALCAPQDIAAGAPQVTIGQNLQLSWTAVAGTSHYRWRETTVGCNGGRTAVVPVSVVHTGAQIDWPDCSYPLVQRYDVSACRSITDCGPYSAAAAAVTVIRVDPFLTDVLTTTYIHTDALRSPVAETSATGAVTKRYRYEPYGAPTNGSYEQGPGYAGHVTDAATGLSYMQQRYYDSVGGRFLSVDPVAASGGSFNRYWYANNSPYKYIDPDGRCPWCLGAILGTGLEISRQIVTGEIKDTSVKGISGNLGKALVAGAAGAAGGGIASGVAKLTASVTIRATLNGAAGAAVGAASAGANNAIEGKEITNGMATSAVFGGVAGAAGSLVDDGISAVKSSLNANAVDAIPLADRNFLELIKEATPNGGIKPSTVGAAYAIGNILSNSGGIVESCGVDKEC